MIKYTLLVLYVFFVSCQNDSQNTLQTDDSSLIDSLTFVNDSLTREVKRLNERLELELSSRLLSECDINSMMRSYSNDTVKIANVTLKKYKEFVPATPVDYLKIQNSDSTQNELVKKFDFIKFRNDSLIINALNRDVVVYKNDGPIDKAKRRYKLTDYYGDNFFLIKEEGYELSGYYFLDVSKKLCYGFEGFPKMIPNHYLYCSGDYYGDAQVSVVNPRSNYLITFELQNTTIDDLFISNHDLCFSVRNPCGLYDWKTNGYYTVRNVTNNYH